MLTARQPHDPGRPQGWDDPPRKAGGMVPADPEHAESGRLDLDDDQDDSDDEQQEGDRIDAESEPDEGQEEDDDPGDLGPVARRGDAEDHEIDPEDEQEGRNEWVRQDFEESHS